MTTDTHATVRQIAIENPASVRVFESLGIDYCCGGGRSLSEACERAKVPLDRVLGLLEGLAAEPVSPEAQPWTQAPLADLTAHIVAQHHSYIRSEAPRLETLAGKVARKHGAAHPELYSIQEFFAAISQELFAHMLKEERILFPMLDRLETDGKAAPIDTPIARMLADHEDAGTLARRIRELASGFQPPDDACPSFRALYHGLEEFERDLHHHVHLENNVLFPRALKAQLGR